MTKTFSQIETLIPKLHGWCEVSRAQAMAAAVFTFRPEVSVIIGVWGGRDTFALALAHKELGRGVVHAIDPWSPTASADGQTGENLKWWGTSNHELVYQSFLTTIGEFGLQDVIHVHRAKSDDVTPPKNIGILCIDGNHGPQAEKDTERYAPNLVNGGLVFADDLHWDGGAVLRSTARLKANGYRELYKLGTGAVYQRLI